MSLENKKQIKHRVFRKIEKYHLQSPYNTVLSANWQRKEEHQYNWPSEEEFYEVAGV